MQELWRTREISQDFHNPETAHRGQITRAFWDLKAESDVRLPRQMIKLRRLDFVDDAANRGGVGEIRIVQEQFLLIDIIVAIERLQSRSFQRTAAADDAMNFVAFFEQKFGQVGTVLTCDSGDERTHSRQSSVGSEIQEDKLAVVSVGGWNG